MKETGQWLPFEEAREVVRSHGLKSCDEWTIFSSRRSPSIGIRPANIPARPDDIYRRSGWAGWADFLGYRPATKWRAFRFARMYAQRLNLKSAQEWAGFCEGRWPALGIRPVDIPPNPEVIYADGAGFDWNYFLGVGAPRGLGPTQKTRSFASAHAFARRLGLISDKEWHSYIRGKDLIRGFSPTDLPLRPNIVYAEKGWESWDHFLDAHDGREGEPRFRHFVEARSFARGLQLPSRSAWYRYAKGKDTFRVPCPEDIPFYPDRVYATSGWSGWGDFLGTGSRRRLVNGGGWMPYAQAREFLQQFNLRSAAEWHALRCGVGSGEITGLAAIPTHADRVYRGKGWTSWGDFLGNGHRPRRPKRKKQWRKFSSARKYARSLALATCEAWKNHAAGNLPLQPECPEDVPSNPQMVYKGLGWISWGDFLGTGNIATNPGDNFSYAEAVEYLRPLCIATEADYLSFLRGESTSMAAPSPRLVWGPPKAYASKGWRGWGIFLSLPPIGEVLAFLRAQRIFSDAELRRWKEEHANDPTGQRLLRNVYSTPGWPRWTSVAAGYRSNGIKVPDSRT